MVSVNPNTGLLRSRTQFREDVRQDIVDRLLTPVGSRAHRPGYGVAALNPPDVTLAAAQAALVPGVVDEVIRASLIDGAVTLDVNVTGAVPEVDFYYGISGAWNPNINAARAFLAIGLDGFAPPDEWISRAPGGMGQRIQLRRLANGAAAFRLWMDTASLWDASESGYEDQYEGWHATMVQGEFAQDIALHRPGAPVETMTPAGWRYQWPMANGGLDNFINWHNANPAAEWSVYIWSER